MGYRILQIIKEWTEDLDGGMDGWWYGYYELKRIFDERYKINLDMKLLKNTVKHMKNEGLLNYTHTYNLDMQIAGKGYFYNYRCEKQSNDLDKC